MDIEFMKLGMRSEKDPKATFYNFNIVAVREWTDKESGEVKKHCGMYLLAFKTPKGFKVTDETVKRVFTFCAKWNVFEEIEQKNGGTVMGVQKAYLDAEKFVEIAGPSGK